MNKDLKNAIDDHGPDDDPIIQSTINNAERMLEAIEKFDLIVPRDISTSHVGGNIYFQWGNSEACALLSIRSDGAVLHGFSDGGKNDLTCQWNINDKLPTKFLMAQQILKNSKNLHT